MLEDEILIRIPTGARFSCYALRTRVSPDFFQPYIIANGVYAFFKSPFQDDEFWKESLGTLHSEQISESSLLLFAFSDSAGVDERSLNHVVGFHYNGLLIQGRGYSTDGILLSGNKTNEGLYVSSVGTVQSYIRPWKVITEPVDVGSLRISVEIAKRLALIFREGIGDNYLRLRKGFNALIGGSQENQAHNRLHQFVRAIEAIIKPDTGNATKQFVYRGQIFAGRSDDARKILRELFEMRSAAEHLNPLKDKLDPYPPHLQENIIALRTYQAELVADNVYTRVLTDDNLLSIFLSDDTISEFWKKSEREKTQIWGKPLDLEGVVKGKFFDYL